MTFKKATDKVSREYWRFVERTAKQVKRELPKWAKVKRAEALKG